jgi:hypothetical protein
MLVDNDCQITKGKKKCHFTYIYFRSIALEAIPCFDVPRHEGGRPSDGLFLLEKFKFSNQKN